MKFTLTPKRHAELKTEISELEQWVRQLESLDLTEYDPTLAPFTVARANEDERPDED
jgi:Asp-tRNA(Asn)/Glu-tRNA(Gln) amidotransferase C subunit